jgi:hypothetical protein
MDQGVAASASHGWVLHCQNEENVEVTQDHKI